MASPNGPVSAFIDRHFLHFNAAVLKDASEAFIRHLDGGGQMLLRWRGDEHGRNRHLARRDDPCGKIYAICCTGANLEEDVFNLVAHSHYERVPHYRDLTPADEQALLDRHLNRVTDTCIPEHEAMRRIEGLVLQHWLAADAGGQRLFPHEFLYGLLRSGALEDAYQIDPKHSWLLAAAEAGLPIFVPGWEDSTLGNVFAAHAIAGKFKSVHTVRSGIEDTYRARGMVSTDERQHLDRVLPDRRRHRRRLSHLRGPDAAPGSPPGGRPVVGLLLPGQRFDDQLWSDSGAVPNEKITWGELGIDTPRFIIESDASIVVPLMFARVLGW